MLVSCAHQASILQQAAGSGGEIYMLPILGSWPSNQELGTKLGFLVARVCVDFHVDELWPVKRYWNPVHMPSLYWPNSNRFSSVNFPSFVLVPWNHVRALLNLDLFISLTGELVCGVPYLIHLFSGYAEINCVFFIGTHGRRGVGFGHTSLSAHLRYCKWW